MDGAWREWDVPTSGLLSAGPTAANVTLRRATLRGIQLLAPAGNAPVRFVGIGFSGPWYLEDLVLITSSSHLVVENSTLVLTPDEFLWQSYFLAASLSDTADISPVVPTFRGTLQSGEMQWEYASTPRTLWLWTNLRTTPRVFPTTVPNSFIMRYLGMETFLTALQMVGTCEELLSAVRAADPARPMYVLVANVSLAACWPADGVAVAAPGFTLMGLPDHTTTLDLGGLKDAMRLAPGAIVSIRFLTLTGLGTHSEYDAGNKLEPADNGAEGLGLSTALLWAFHFPRCKPVRLEYVTLVMPYFELQQYGILALQSSSAAPALNYFSALGSFILASIVEGASSPGLPPSPSRLSSANATVGLLQFRKLVLPGVTGSDTNLTWWPGLYPGWGLGMYGTAGSGGGGGDGGGGGWVAWRVGVLAGGLVAAALLVVAMVLLYRRGGGDGSAHRRKGGRYVEGGSGGPVRGSGSGGGGGSGREASGRSATATVMVTGGRAASVQRRPPLYDSFDDPVFELGFFKRGLKPNAEEIQIILNRANTEAAEFDLRCAVKVMAFDELTAIRPLGSEQARQQCMREAALCCTMHHPNVVNTLHYYLKPVQRVSMLHDMLMEGSILSGGRKALQPTPASHQAGEARRSAKSSNDLEAGAETPELEGAPPSPTRTQIPGLGSRSPFLIPGASEADFADSFIFPANVATLLDFSNTSDSCVVAAATAAIAAASAADARLPFSSFDTVLPAELAPVVYAALGIASGVAYLHTRSIIHGDLSANNVLLTSRGPAPVLRPFEAKLSDFGLSLR
ncbi:hypothetical protein TSOC_000425 [Tetrabaena socialis]|uniref:Protein kinase domain-containing protein n=1 Tax=Tetrabaena socialis TaxID=47790 RepID=A0A2J8AJF9_9CHLO|nr:hypothetical protein TSOC_000425 [Tetrabaena socialis]|eukprot:PNH12648.1 hypothetical protein TSOC_000425 [Tetrabaena socialis]